MDKEKSVVKKLFKSGRLHFFNGKEEPEKEPHQVRSLSDYGANKKPANGRTKSS